MRNTICILNIVVCVFTIALSIRAIRSKRPMLLPIYLITFTLTNVLGMSFAFVPELNRGIWRGMYDGLVQDKDFLNLAVCCWIFLLGGCALIQWNFAKAKSIAVSPLIVRSDAAFGMSLLLLLMGHILYTKFMLLGPGLSLARETNFFQYDVGSAYEMRGDILAYVGEGQGLLMATVAAFSVFPLSAWFASFSSGGALFAPLVIGICAFWSLLFSVALRQKAPVVIMTLVYGLLIIQYNRTSLLRVIIKRLNDAKLIVLGSLLFIAALAYFYQITEGENLEESLSHCFYRLFLIPVASNQAWFVAFPDILHFRGFIGIFDTIFWSIGNFPIGVPDVAEAITTFRFSLNASMIAVAWSAAGIWGVIGISAVFLLTAWFIDGKLIGFDSSTAMPLLILALPSFIALTSTSFFDFTMKGGFINQFVVIAAFSIWGVRTPGKRLEGDKRSGLKRLRLLSPLKYFNARIYRGREANEITKC